jgi:hypothetical protein
MRMRSLHGDQLVALCLAPNTVHLSGGGIAALPISPFLASANPKVKHFATWAGVFGQHLKDSPPGFAYLEQAGGPFWAAGVARHDKDEGCRASRKMSPY